MASKRLEATPLTVNAATLLFSLTYDATTLGAASTHPAEVERQYQHLNESRKKLVEYISDLERRAGMQQETFFRFD